MVHEDYIFFGRNILREAFAARAPVLEIYASTDPARDFVASLPEVSQQQIPIKKKIPHRLRNQAHQGVAFRTSHEFYFPLSSLALNRLPFVILCNQVQDIHNFGSIARCAVSFGAKLLIHEDSKSAELTAAAMKSSAGLAFQLSFSKVPHLSVALQKLREAGFSIVGLEANDPAISISEWMPRFPLALVLGSEGSGISPGVKSQCENLVRIPMEKTAESLNVSHAAAVAMSWAYLQSGR